MFKVTQPIDEVRICPVAHVRVMERSSVSQFR